MKYLSLKEKIIIGLMIVAFLVGGYFWGSRSNGSGESISKEEISQLKEKENQDLTSIGDQEDKVYSLVVKSEKDEVNQGESLQFYAELTSSTLANTDVTWHLGPGHKEQTSIDENGLLTVAIDEMATSLDITAKSVADKTIYTTKNIKVVKNSLNTQAGQDNKPVTPVTVPKNREELRQVAQVAQNSISQAEKEAKIKQDKAIKQKAIQESSKGKKDKYQTDPTPAGRPTPVEPEDVVVDENVVLTATISITCDTILNNIGQFDMDKIDLLPVDGVILPATNVTFKKGESVYDVLNRITKERKIHMESEFTPAFNSAYVQGIHNLYEFDCGELSGWMYKVNGWFPNYGCSRYALNDGDIIEWVYTCDLGKDVGDNSMVK